MAVCGQTSMAAPACLSYALAGMQVHACAPMQCFTPLRPAPTANHTTPTQLTRIHGAAKQEEEAAHRHGYLATKATRDVRCHLHGVAAGRVRAVWQGEGGQAGWTWPT